MFDNLTERLNRTLKNISGQGRITEDNIKDTLREVRTALLEADVALPVVKSFTSRVKERALGQQVSLSLTPGQEFIKIVYAELVNTMGGEAQEINLACQPPAVILLAGLQGAGKTTSAAKLALYLKERLKKKVLMVSADTYRPAAIEQLATLGKETGTEVFPSNASQKPQEIAAAALDHAKRYAYEVLIVDTAGRLSVDEAMMAEIKDLHALLNPIETFFVVDAMTGQDAANTAKAFGEALPLTGVILTKADGDARGGAALSVREVTGKPIKFIGLGEKIKALEPFYPDRIASRILDMGDLLSLIEELQRTADETKAKKLATKLKKGEGFDLEDFRSQLQEMKKMGGMTGLLDKLPGMSGMADQLKDKLDDKRLLHLEAIINSMTPKERAHPAIIKGSRKKRIAAGAGVEVYEVNQLLRQFDSMQHMMRKMGKGGMRKMAGAMRGMLGGMGGMGAMAQMMGRGRR
ncbi:MAG: signal recognition particle protein [Proteobacteria bacterium]|uniref:Signal recognition particle protein n=1 Tax=Candidatus Avisuccinivibrio stercorigallinarum TaxID=2840704 RepID=A0A9D9GS57_9GAMM|nr:signal recognition particle protein [Candidatus Avisuccinivibrio stercorigallinarum]